MDTVEAFQGWEWPAFRRVLGAERPAMVDFFGRMPPHRFILACLGAMGWKPEQIEHSLFAESLADITSRLLKADASSLPKKVHWHAHLAKQLDRPLHDFISPRNRLARERFSPLLDRACREITLGKLIASAGTKGAAGEIVNSQLAVIDGILVADRVDGSKEALGQLVERHQASLSGWLRTRCHPNDVEDLLQDCWVQIDKKLSKYDPIFGTPQQFIRFWRQIMLLRYYRKRSDRLELIALREDLMEQYDDPDLDRELAESLEGGGPPAVNYDARDCLKRVLAFVFGSQRRPHFKFAWLYVDPMCRSPHGIVENRWKTPYSALFVETRDYFSLALNDAEGAATAFEPLSIQITGHEKARLCEQYVSRNPSAKNMVARVTDWAFTVRFEIIDGMSEHAINA